MTPEKEDASDPFGRQKLGVYAAPAEMSDCVLKSLAAFPVQDGILMAENEGILFLGHREDTGKESHIAFPDVETFAQCLHGAPSRKFLNPVTEHEEVGQFARQGGSLEVSVEKPVHAAFCNSVKVGGMGGLERGTAVQDGVTSVTEAIEKKEDAAHVRIPWEESAPL